MGLVTLRRRPAGAQFGKEIADRVEVVVRPLVFCCVLLRRYALDRELQVLAIGIEDLRYTGPGTEDAAEARRARPVVHGAAGAVREWNRIDLLLALPRIGSAGRDRDEADHKENDDTP